MFCKNCGHERQAGEKFCPVCGTPFPEEDGNQDVVPNVTSTNQDSERNAIDNNVVVDTPTRKEPTPIVNNYNGGSYSPTSEPTKSSNKSVLITICVLALVIILGVTVSVLSSSDSSESSADNSESVNTTDNSGSDEQGSGDNNNSSSVPSDLSWIVGTWRVDADANTTILLQIGDGRVICQSTITNGGQPDTSMGTYYIQDDVIHATFNDMGGLVTTYPINRSDQTIDAGDGLSFYKVR